MNRRQIRSYLQFILVSQLADSNAIVRREDVDC